MFKENFYNFYSKLGDQVILNFKLQAGLSFSNFFDPQFYFRIGK